ncbi:MAG: molybdenum ABC transporter ATP-binding protein [Halieaceae bacterium]|nr:molybdenum ABC transporter ATP-binding protein [Halieaceae bacterium]
MSEIGLKLALRRGEFSLAIDTVLPAGSVTGVYGVSGSGKTSLLSCIAGLAHAHAGSDIRIGDERLEGNGQWLAPEERDVAYVFQDARLFPHLDVAGNLEFALSRRHRDGPGLTEVSDWLGISDMLARRSSQLSRGQQQRVAIARALLSGPRLVLMDEPLANIDSAGRRDILARLARIRRELDVPMIYVSHDMAELAELADHLLVLDDGQLVAEGPLLELSSRLELALSHQEQAAAVVRAKVAEHDADYELSRLQFEGQPLWVSHLDLPPGTPLRLRLPARDISLCLEQPGQTSILNLLPARIADIETCGGSRVLVQLKVGEQFLLARITRKSVDTLGLAVGDEVFAQVKSVALLNDSLDD